MLNFDIKNNKLNNNIYHISSHKRDALSIIDMENDLNISHQYVKICHQYNIDNKWILMINPNEESIQQLSQNNNINTSKILTVYTNKVNAIIANIERALCKGNCAAIVLCNSQLSDDEILQLSKCAQSGKTSCIVLRNNRKLH